MVPVEILLNFGNHFLTLQLGFWKYLSEIVFLHPYVHNIGLFFSQAHSIWPKPRAFNPDRKSMGTPTFYCDALVQSNIWHTNAVLENWRTFLRNKKIMLLDLVLTYFVLLKTSNQLSVNIDHVYSIFHGEGKGERNKRKCTPD